MNKAFANDNVVRLKTHTRKTVPNAQGAWPAVLTPAEAAKYLRLSRKKLDNIVKRGEIAHRREGRSIRFALAALDAWLMSENRTEKENLSERSRS